MKNPLLKLAIFCILISTKLSGQQPVQNLNTLITPAKSLANERLEAVKVTNLITLNTDGIEYCPVFYKNGMVFSSDRYLRLGLLSRWLNNNNSNIYFTGIAESGQTYEPIPLPGEVNSKRHEGSTTFSADGEVMIYTRNCDKPSSGGFYELKLSSARFEKGQWVDHMDLPFQEGYRTCHPALSKDGQLLIFASNRPNGLGGMDLYASEFENGEWTTPFNLGQEVNSSGDEVFPFLDAESNLYFASNGRPGIGGLDVFKATRNEEGNWIQSLRLPEPFNTRWDDFSFVTNASLESGFFSSNRPGGKGLDDIYAWKITNTLPLPEPALDDDAILTQITALDEQTGLPLQGTRIILIEINPKLLQTGFLNEPISIVNKLNLNVAELLGKQVQPIQSPASFSLYPISANEHYLLIAERENGKIFQQLVNSAHLTANDSYVIMVKEQHTEMMLATNLLPSVTTTMAEEANEFVVGGMALVETEEEENKPEEIFTAREIPTAFLKPNMAPLADAALPEKHRVLSFSNLYHEFNTSTIADNEVLLVTNIIYEMQRHPEYHLTIRSHTDQRGTTDYNLSLSQKRALGVMKKLIDGGIAPERLSAIGLGEAFPILDCQEADCTEEDHKLNRRTELVLNQHFHITNKQ
jgi:outer membrane protein OmpA-like peptidoglycan-associated protein